MSADIILAIVQSARFLRRRQTITLNDYCGRYLVDALARLNGRNFDKNIEGNILNIVSTKRWAEIGDLTIVQLFLRREILDSFEVLDIGKSRLNVAKLKDMCHNIQ